MRSRTMNATGLGSKSYENDRDVILSPRRSSTSTARHTTIFR